MSNEHGYQRTAFVEMQLKQAQKLRPPPAKVQQIFHEHCVKGRTQDDVARQFGCKQQYVSKCKRKMEKYLGTTVGRAGMGDWVQRKGVVDHVYRERLTHVFGECLQAFKGSFQRVQSRKVTRIEGKPDKNEYWERETQGNWRWADLALKAAHLGTEFEFESGACDQPAAVDATDEESETSVERMFSKHVYLDRRPTEAELVDARTIHVRLEEQRKLLVEDRRLLAIERAAVAKLQKELAGMLAVGRVSLPVGAAQEPSLMERSSEDSTGRETRPTTEMAVKSCEDSTGKETRPTGTGKEKPRPQFTWRFASREDFSYAYRRRLVKERIDATVRRLGFCPPFTSGPPLEVKKGVFIVPEPHPSDEIDKAKYRAEYLRQEAEARAEGRKWREPAEKFRKDGTVLQGGGN